MYYYYYYYYLFRWISLSVQTWLRLDSQGIADRFPEKGK